MQHKISKFKIKKGNDANQMLLKKLVRNFVENGSLKTTMTKARYLKSTIETLSHSALNYKESTKNVLLPYFGTTRQVLEFVEAAKLRSMNATGSGIVKVIKLGARMSDAVQIGRVTWSKELEVTKKPKAKKTDTPK